MFVFFIQFSHSLFFDDPKKEGNAAISAHLNAGIVLYSVNS